ncbi:MAG TPA: erythromycin esterase family protein, partial [Anaerolineae bacterium]|nr:erythromycin esterase family protein [Anaerolineae bacterium]
MKKLFILFLLLTVACGKADNASVPPTPSTQTTAAAQAAQIDKDIVTWLQGKAVPFDTAEPDENYDDLMPLNNIIGDAQIVALGEATHGTHEFSAMKHRIFQFLVKEKGFNAIALEVPWAEAELINRYVRTGEGNPEELLAGLHFWITNTEELLAMIEWMRSHNQNPGDAPQVSFYGLDMQFPAMPMGIVIDYFEQIDPEKVSLVNELYACFQPYANYYNNKDTTKAYNDLPGEEKALCGENLQQVSDILANNQETYQASSSASEFAHVSHAAKLVTVAQKYLGQLESKSDFYGAEVRDKFM